MRRFCSKLDDSHLLRWLRWQNVQRARRRRKVVTKLFVTFCALGSHQPEDQEGVAQCTRGQAHSAQCTRGPGGGWHNQPAVKVWENVTDIWPHGHLDTSCVWCHFIMSKRYYQAKTTNIQTLWKMLHISDQSKSKWAVVSFQKLQTLRTWNNADILDNCCSPLVFVYNCTKMVGIFFYRYQGIFFFP